MCCHVLIVCVCFLMFAFLQALNRVWEIHLVAKDEWKNKSYAWLNEIMNLKSFKDASWLAKIVDESNIDDVKYVKIYDSDVPMNTNNHNDDD